MSGNLIILIFLGLGLLVGIGLVVYNIFFVEEEDEDEDKPEGYDGGATMIERGDADADTLGETMAATSAEYKGARKSQMLALKDSLERSLEGREGQGAESKDRMSMPWFLLVGASGSGKTTMLANTGLPLPYGPAFEVDSRKRDAGRWWLFEDAVVLEAPPASAAAAASDSTLPPGQTLAADTGHGWGTLLELLRRERPDSPLNGIIVTVSCADLVAGGRDSEKLIEVAERIRSFLDKVRNVLGVRLPLHILVTKCDVLPGFRSFAENLPTGRRNDIFGWANPNKLETAYNPSWVDVGCDLLKKQLEDLRDEVLAAPDEIKDADGLFVFVSQFGNLQEPLRDFVSRLYPEGEKRPSLFFRGMYFCGDTMDPELQQSVEAEHMASGKSRATMQLSAEVALTGTTKSHNLVFLKSLFLEKIFKEAGLARPMARFRLSRDRRVVVAQAAAAIIAVVGGTGLWTTVNGTTRGDSASPGGLKAEAEALAHALAGMAIDLDEVRRGGGPASNSAMHRRSREAAVIELVGEMRSLHALKRSPFIPASWFSQLPNDVKSSMEAGIQDIVLPVIRQRLEERAAALIEAESMDSLDGPGSVVGNSGALAEYLNEVRDVSRRITQYNRLAAAGSGNLADLASLLDYLFGVQLDLGSTVSEDFQIALRAATAPTIVLSPQAEATVLARALRMLSSIGDQAGRQLAKPRNAQAERAINPEDDLKALRQLGTLVELSDPRRGLVASVSEATLLKVNIAQQVQDSIQAQLKRAAVRISGDSAAADLATARLRSVIDTLFSLRLMGPSEEGVIVSDFPPDMRLRWDVGSLELAIAMRQESIKALLAVSTAMPGQSPERLRRAFDIQLRARVLGVVASAQRLTPIASASVPTVEVRLGASNLEAASPRLVKLGRLLDTLNAGAEGRRLLSSAMRQAEQVLGAEQAVLESESAMLPQSDKVAAWQGVIPLSWAAVNVSDSLRFETSRLVLESQIRAWTNDIEPLLRVLTVLARIPGDTVRVPRLVAEWGALVATMQRYDRGETGGTASALRRYLNSDLAVRDLESCGTTAALPDTTKPSADPFIRRRRMFRAALAARCGTAGAEAVASYQKLRTVFTTRLAGRYPFVDSTQTEAPDADPVLLRDFLIQFDAFMSTGDVALRSDPSRAAQSKAAVEFLAAMLPVRAFLAPLVDAPERRPLEYTLIVPAADSATGRELSVGGRTASVDNQPHALGWRSGDAIRLVQRDSARARLVSSSRGGWSVFQVPRELGVRFFNTASKAELTPPVVFPTQAPDIALPGSPPPAQPVQAPVAPRREAPQSEVKAPPTKGPSTKRPATKRPAG